MDGVRIVKNVKAQTNDRSPVGLGSENCVLVLHEVRQDSTAY